MSLKTAFADRHLKQKIMSKRKHVNAVFATSENVSQYLTDALTFYTAISTTPGGTFLTITPAAITAAQGRVAAARTAESAVGTGTMGLAAARDLAVGAVETDVKNFTALVQIAANNAVDVATAKTIITECGLVTKRNGAKTKDGFSVTINSVTAGLLDLVYKAPVKNVKASYETQQSMDNVNWLTVNISPDSRNAYAHGMPSGTKLYFRGRVILSVKKGGAQVWLTPSASFIYTL